MRNLSDLSILNSVSPKVGFVYEDHLNYLIDLNDSPGEVLQTTGSRQGEHIRRGVAKGAVIVEEMENRDSPPMWYELVRKSYTAAHVPLADHTLFEAASSICSARCCTDFGSRASIHNMFAASVELLYKDTIYGWYSGV